MENGSFSGLGLIERSSCSVLSPEVMLVSVVCAVTGDHGDDVSGLFYHWRTYGYMQSAAA